MFCLAKQYNMNRDFITRILPYSGLLCMLISPDSSGKNTFCFDMDFTDYPDNKHTIAPACVQISYSAVKAMQRNDPFSTRNSAPGHESMQLLKRPRDSTSSLTMWLNVIWQIHRVVTVTYLFGIHTLISFRRL